MIDGILNVYKEAGFTSFDVVAKLRCILRQKKIGHTGTLDPMAEGVLPVCLGKATKLVDLLTEGDKCYRASMKLGFETDTEDITGTAVCQVEPSQLQNVTEEKVKDVFQSFIGEYDQIPPMYSAIKKNGKKLYEYARAGIEIERESRPVRIYNIDNIEYEDGMYCFDVYCSKGTYIRSLCRDIGRKLGCYATLTKLTRLSAHGFKIQNALTLSMIESYVDDGLLEQYVMPVDSVLSEYPICEITEAGSKYLHNGNKLSPNYFKCPVPQLQKRIRVYENGIFFALYDYEEQEQIYKPFKMFLS